jgi:plasmid stabilization system protein ParE
MKVFLSPLADRKIIYLLDYLENEWSGKVKDKFLSKLIKAFDRISEQPRIGLESNSFKGLF